MFFSTSLTVGVPRLQNTSISIDRSPAGENPLADVGLEVRPVLTRAQLDAVRG